MPDSPRAVPSASRAPFQRAASLLLVAALLGPACLGPATAQQPAPVAPGAAAAATPRLPDAGSTRHRLELPGRTLSFTATAGAVTLTSNAGEPEADIAFIAFTLDGPEAAARPVTFAVNGGPGAASAYLNIGVLGPWILPMDDRSIVPSQPALPVANPDTWLDFTDLVFIDPVGTGFSRLVDPDDARRDRFLSVDGDVEAISDFIRRWLTANGRTASPKYFVGESYGGFRGPLVAEHLQTEEGIGLSGLVLVSPVLDFGWWRQPSYAPLPKVSLLPSLAAAAMEADGAISEDRLQAAEDYAQGDFVSDLLLGVQDPEAVARIVDRVSAITGLDRRAVARASGRVDARAFLRDILRNDGRLASAYDPSIVTADPSPEDEGGRGADPVLDAMTAPLTGAMLTLYRDTLGWVPDRRYVLLNRQVSGGWDWGDDWGQPQAVGALRRVLALDPEFRLLVVHGLTDLVTPYFGSELILRQLPSTVADRVRQSNYPGGHMFYLREPSRRAFRDDARALYSAEAG